MKITKKELMKSGVLWEEMNYFIKHDGLLFQKFQDMNADDEINIALMFDDREVNFKQYFENVSNQYFNSVEKRAVELFGRLEGRIENIISNLLSPLSQIRAKIEDISNIIKNEVHKELKGQL